MPRDQTMPLDLPQDLPPEFEPSNKAQTASKSPMKLNPVSSRGFHCRRYNSPGTLSQNSYGRWGESASAPEREPGKLESKPADSDDAADGDELYYRMRR